MKFHTDGTLPDPRDHRVVFVFGSNLAGVHGAGAARVALEQFDAVDGRGVGYHGGSYAIPTMDQFIHTLPLEVIANYVAHFITFAHTRKQLNFFVTRIGCGLAGYTDDQIAPLFKAAPANCSFAKEWKPYLQIGKS